MTADEAAAWLNVPRSTIMRAIRMGRLPGAKIGNNYRILRSDLEQFMKPSPSST
jgi:excisionase family DNA binding protein